MLKPEVGHINLIKDRGGIYRMQAGYGGGNMKAFRATEDNIIKAHDYVTDLYKTKFPNALLDSEFANLRLNDENINLSNEEFAKKIKNRTTQQGKKWTYQNVSQTNIRMGIADEVNPTRIKKYSIKQIKDVIRESSGGQKFINANMKNEEVLKREADRLRANKRSAGSALGFPTSDNNPSKMWRNFYESSRKGDRIKVRGTFNGKDLSNPANWPKTKEGSIDWRARGTDDVPFYQKIKFQDTQAPNKAVFSWEKGEDIVGGNLKNQIDSVFGEGFFAKSTKAYSEQALDRKTMIKTKDGLKSISEILGEKLIRAEATAEGIVPTEEYILEKKKNFALKDVHHNKGIANDPYSTESTLRSANRKLSRYEREYAEGRMKPNEFIKKIREIAKEHGGIRREVEGAMVGKKATQESVLQKIAERTGLNKKTYDQILKSYQNVGIGKNCKAYGGRVGFQEAGAVGVSQCMRNAIQEHNRKLKGGDRPALEKQMKINKTKTMKDILKLGPRSARGLINIIGGPAGAAFEVAIEGAFYKHGKRQGQTDEQARENLFFPKLIEKMVFEDIKDTELWKEYGIKPFKTGLTEGPEGLIEEELVAGNERAKEYQDNIKAIEEEYANTSKIEFELKNMKNLRLPVDPEVIRKTEQKLEESYDRIEELQINIKEGSPLHEAYVMAQEKQKAAQDTRAQKEWGDTPGYSASKQRKWRDEFLDYREAKVKHGVEHSFKAKDEFGREKVAIDPYGFKEGKPSRLMLGPGDLQDYYEKDLGYKPEEAISQKWKDIYEYGGFDLLDRVGITGGISKMAKGGVATLAGKRSEPMPQGLNYLMRKK
tara:strand:+ start:12 stop:2489 length:2478 start_codon:yes stop_codon:yes gene_type:complete